ncbi:hypothetical protein PoB_006505600 [Plakobranchus ocellatus]|uniref:Uncharacterized protein n=1 Tax=Plakobranchus ocellatus TaxID=259542 RepID=A0AAV4D3H5_9GAST|nr:hypothetical protein PoB_006505600 [Plakobranchus ocellatus]
MTIICNNNGTINCHINLKKIIEKVKVKDKTCRKNNCSNSNINNGHIKRKKFIRKKQIRQNKEQYKCMIANHERSRTKLSSLYSPDCSSLPATDQVTEGGGSPAKVAVKVRGEPTVKDTTLGVKFTILGGKDTGPSKARPSSDFSEAEES